MARKNQIMSQLSRAILVWAGAFIVTVLAVWVLTR